MRGFCGPHKFVLDPAQAGIFRQQHAVEKAGGWLDWHVRLFAKGVMIGVLRTIHELTNKAGMNEYKVISTLLPRIVF